MAAAPMILFLDDGLFGYAFLRFDEANTVRVNRLGVDDFREVHDILVGQPIVGAGNLAGFWHRPSEPVVHRGDVLETHHAGGIFVVAAPESDPSPGSPPLVGDPQTRRGNQQAKQNEFEDRKRTGGVIRIGVGVPIR